MEERSEYQKKTEHDKREKLRKIKPKVVAKFEKYEELHESGHFTPIIEFTYDFRCNMSCPHCSNLCFSPKERSLTPEIIKRVCDEADGMGLAQTSISGGEPLMFPDLEDVVNAIGPDRFHISMSTNGALLSEKKAKWVKSIGIDKVKISLDCIDEDGPSFHDKGQTSAALRALQAAKAADLQPVAQTVFTHQNCQTNDTERMLAYCQEHGIQVDVMLAKAIGRWEGKEEILVTGADLKHIRKLHEKYPVLTLDTFPTYQEKVGSCGAVKKILEITKYGDVMPCVFMHFSLGNVFDDSLAEIMRRGLSIKYFREDSPICLSGVDRRFIKNHMSKFYGKKLPIDYREAFSEEDFVKDDDAE
jgi:coenzyme PQQ synthesis protein E